MGNNLSTLYKSTSYRYDIQGLRAIGALLIMIYHIWVGKVSGGVDVFFVISGYFMAGLLIRLYINTGELKPFIFWGRIIRRIAPLGYIVIAFTLIMGYIFLPANYWRHDMQGVIASILHMENWYLIFRNADYLASNNPPSPVQQFWALSIQIQFYLLLPLVIYIGLKLVKNFRSSKFLVYWILTLLLCSFIYSAYFTKINPSAAYFHTATRAWEFLFGVIIFLILPYIRVSEVLSKAMMWLGFILIISVGVIVPKDVAYPGTVALLPVLAACSILIGGKYDSSSVIFKILSSKILVYIGGLSFAIYLWHWPILIYSQHYFNIVPGEISLAQGLFIILLSFILAILSKKFIEDPISNINKSNSVAAYIIGTLCCAFVLLPTLYLYLKIDTVHNKTKIASFHAPYYTGKSIEIQNGKHQVNLQRFIANKADINTPSLDGTSNGISSSGEILFGEYGNKNSERTVLMIGGSKNAHWEPFFEYLSKKYDFRVIVLNRTGCSFGYNPNIENSESYNTCREWNKKAIRFISNMDPKPSAVVMNTSRHAGKEEFVPSGYINSAKLVLDKDIPVIGIRINPLFNNPNDCLWRATDISDCAVAYTSSLQAENPMISVKKEHKLSKLYLVDFTNVLCTDQLCPASLDGYLVMTDNAHLTRSYINYISPAMESAFFNQVPNFLDIIK